MRVKQEANGQWTIHSTVGTLAHGADGYTLHFPDKETAARFAACHADIDAAEEQIQDLLDDELNWFPR